MAAQIDSEKCTMCGGIVQPLCVEACPTGALNVDVNRGNVRVIDESRCDGCELCLEACPYLPQRIIWNHRTHKAIKCDLCINTPYWEEAGGPDGRQVCVEVCPVKALSFDADTGAVVVNEERCIGCKECALHCPFGAANIHPITKKAFKCDLCNGDPVCAKRCPTGAITYGPLDVRVRKTRRKRGEEMHQILEEKGWKRDWSPSNIPKRRANDDNARMERNHTPHRFDNKRGNA